MKQASTSAKPRVSALAAGALLFDSTQPLDERLQASILFLSEELLVLSGVRETVPGMNNLMVVFDPLAADREAIIRRVCSRWGDSPARASNNKIITVEVVYGGEAGLDLEGVAARSGLSIDEVVEIHASATYTVYCLGAHPGFAYLGGLDPRLHTPRRREPRSSVPAGTVAIGGSQTGVIAQTSPSGWQLIGSSDRSFFDPFADPPTLLAPGDRVRFRCVRVEK